MTFSAFPNLKGGAGNDVFAFATGGSLDGNIDGGPGSNSLDYSADASPATVDLQTGQATGLGGSFTNIQNFTGNTAATLIGPDSGTTFNITGLNAGNVNGFNFSAFPNLEGGAGADRFVFWSAGSLTGNVDGGAGTDTLDYSQRSSLVAVTILGASTLEGLNGTGTSLNGFSHINILVGSSGGGNTLTGADFPSTWSFGVSDTYTSGAGTASFTAFENLVGGTGDDIFVFQAGGTFAGALDGAGGTNTLDDSACTSVCDVMLTAKGTQSGFQGTQASLGGFFDNIDQLIGSSTTADSLEGMDATASWKLGATDQYAVDTNTLAFSNFANLNGGSGADTFYILTSQTANLSGGSGDNVFVFSNGVVLSGTLDGGADNDTLDISAFATRRSVYLTGVGSLDGFRGYEVTALPQVYGFDNIDAIIATSATGLSGDELYGPNDDVTWNIQGLNGNGTPLEPGGRSIH